MKEKTEALVYATGGVVIGGALGFWGADFMRWLLSDSTIPAASDWLRNISEKYKIVTTVVGGVVGLTIGTAIWQTIAGERVRPYLDENLRKAAFLERQERGSAKIAAILSLATVLTIGAGAVATEIGQPAIDVIGNLPKGEERIVSGVIGALTNPSR